MRALRLHSVGGARLTDPTAAGAPGFTRGFTSAVLARGYKPRASGEPKARPLTRASAKTDFFKISPIYSSNDGNGFSVIGDDDVLSRRRRS